MKIIAIIGPTAVGKTDISIEIAKRLNGEIINLDSVQIYKYLDIGSAKPSKEEREQIPHHLIDCVDPFTDFSVSDYKKMANEKIREIISRGKLPILVGGTGLYLNSLYYIMNFNDSKQDLAYRSELEELAKVNGNEFVHNLLMKIDESSASQIHPNNLKRVIRALEINKISGKNKKDYRENLILNEDYEFILIGLNMDRKKLYARINRRVDSMIDNGLIDEVKKLKSLGLNDSFNSMKGIGYKEVLGYLDKKYELDTMITLIKLNSRHYAKRQLTWFKQYEKMKWFDLDTYSNINGTIIDIERYILEQD
ncbi:MAG: tRNA (adenosine(37)-N6)-dimethylallyltransferase MiaA [Clostridiales bacterium]|nr:tRNA (adenosine(37)-N6)-dimethylallyltransferase MiaA [Clostridiales bacterium]